MLRSLLDVRRPASRIARFVPVIVPRQLRPYIGRHRPRLGGETDLSDIDVIEVGPADPVPLNA